MLLQTGQARRQAFLDRQNKLYQRLEHVRGLELELEKEAKRMEKLDTEKLDGLMAEYRLNLNQLNEKLHLSRSVQLEHLKEKLETKKQNQKRGLSPVMRSIGKQALEILFYPGKLQGGSAKHGISSKSTLRNDFYLELNKK